MNAQQAAAIDNILADWTSRWMGRAEKEFCSRPGCIRDAVVVHTPPDEPEWFECAHHTLTMEEYCPYCKETREVIDFATGPDLGGAGTVDFYTFDCGHQRMDEDSELWMYE